MAFIDSLAQTSRQAAWPDGKMLLYFKCIPVKHSLRTDKKAGNPRG